MFYKKKNTKIEIKKRINRLSIVIIGIFILLGWRVDIVRRDSRSKPEIQVSMSGNHTQKENISDYNYMLLDRDGEELFSTKSKYKLVIDTLGFRLNTQNQNIKQMLTFASIMTSIDEEFSFDKIMKHQGKLYYNITEEDYKNIKENLADMRGIYVYEYQERVNQESWRIENIIQSTTDFQDNTKEKNENSLEMQIKKELSINENPKWVFEKDVDGKYEDGQLQLNKNNLNVKLTLDKEIQQNVRGILNDEKYKEYPNMGAILIEGNTGKILALAQKDETQPNIVTGAAVNGFEPGSVFKILTLEAAMEYNGVNLSDTIICTGVKCKPDKIHGEISISDAFKVSCNDAFVKLGVDVSKDKLINFAKKQHVFDKVLGLDSRAETMGKVSEAPDDIANISMGQSVQTTLLQMTGMISTVVNEGEYIQPYIVDSLVNQNGEVVKIINANKEKVVSKNVADSVKIVMNGTVANGTAIVTKIPGIEVGAKTGTAQTGSQFNGWFIGYFKYNNKYYTLGVFVPNIGDKNEEGYTTAGANTAGPVFKDIILNIVNKK